MLRFSSYLSLDYIVDFCLNIDLEIFLVYICFDLGYKFVF